VRLGDCEVDRDRALALLVGYALSRAETVRLYDLAGVEDGQPGPNGAARPVDAVTLSDIGRLVAINAGLAAADVAVLLDVDAAAEFAAVPAAARLEEWEPGGRLDDAATALYDQFRLGGIGQAKRSKLLHLKRPWLVPIADSRVMKVYQNCAATLAAELGLASGHWVAVRDDLIAATDDFVWITRQLKSHHDDRIRRVAHLTRLRLLDIVAWLISDD
jgi:hypothetical protein